MIHESALVRKSAVQQGRSAAVSRVAREWAPPASRFDTLRGRIGNQGVNALVRQIAADPASALSGPNGATMRVQAKLAVNEPGDRYEQEADRVADAVMKSPQPDQALRGASPISRMPPASAVQRLCAQCEDERQKRTTASTATPTLGAVQRKRSEAAAPEVNASLSARIGTLRGAGHSLPTATRAFFESRFSADFSQVRVHTDAGAQSAARSLGAKAFTVGRDIGFGAGNYAPESREGQFLLAHELTHVMQQSGADVRRAESLPALSGPTGVVQRAGDPAKIPPGFRCPTDLSAGRPSGTDILFNVDGFAITPAHTAQLTAFRTAWLAAGGTDDIVVHGYASTDGNQGPNWTLSCGRAEAVQAELIRLGIPPVRISILAHGESTDFGPSLAANRHAVVTSRAGGIVPLPLASGVLTARDNFAGRSTTRFGVGEIIDLNFASLPPRPAIDFGGLTGAMACGGGTLAGATNVGTATYTAPVAAGIVRLELRVAGGATAGRVVSAHTITIAIPSAVRMVAVAGTAPGFSLTGPIRAGTWGAGFQANVFVDPKDVSFQGTVFGEGTVASVNTGSFQGSFVHPVNTFGPGHAGNVVTGTPVSPPVDNIVTERKGPAGSVLGVPTCGASDFLWAIPWEFSVSGGPRTPFAAGFTANHHATSSLFCDARIEKGGAGPFCRRINGTGC
jgi:outer membrane protein OmpA-like peptidoglycan-associated protein